jgi:hypothetical protein
MSERPEPHRISLARGWKYSKDWQRFFHKPTNLCEQSVVRLRIESDRPLREIQLNGQILEIPQRSSLGSSQGFSLGASLGTSQGSSLGSTGDSGAENSARFGYDWHISQRLEARNELVLAWPNPDPKTQESEPQIEVWLEIFAP